MISHQKENSAVSVKVKGFLPFQIKELKYDFVEKIVQLSQIILIDIAIFH